MDKFIRDNDKIRNCIKNEANMNVLQHIYYYTFVWGYGKEDLYDLLSVVKNLFSSVFYLIAYAIYFILYPLLASFRSCRMIKSSKKEVIKRAELYKEYDE